MDVVIAQALELVGRAISAGHDNYLLTTTTSSTATPQQQQHPGATDAAPPAGSNSSSSSSQMAELAAAYNTQGLVLRAMGDIVRTDRPATAAAGLLARHKARPWC